MAVSVARDTIVCPGCGSKRVVTQRQRRRHTASAAGIPCTTCRGVEPLRQKYVDDDLKFWLNRYGANCCPPGQTARAYILAGGTPPELRELARQIFPVRRT